MTINCPVCDRPQVEELICPNCGANLSSYQMLVNLPVEKESLPKKKRIFYLWLPIAILFLLLGLGLGFLGKSIVAKETIDNTQPYTKVLTSTENNEALKLPTITTIKYQSGDRNDFLSCGGFNYVVRSGDSLSLIARRFYGDFKYLSWIGDVNLQLKGRENYIEIGEQILIPNLEC